MKTTLTLLLLCFALSGFTQYDFKETTFKIYFEGCVQLVQLDDFENQGFYCDQVVKFKTNNYEVPFHIIVATDSTRGNLILTHSEKRLILANWNGRDMVLGGDSHSDHNDINEIQRELNDIKNEIHSLLTYW